MNRCLSLSDAPAHCFDGLHGFSPGCGAGYVERFYHAPIEVDEEGACETSAFFVSGRTGTGMSALGWRGDWAAWFYPEQNIIAAVRFCRYTPDEAPPEWLALELISQVCALGDG